MAITPLTEGLQVPAVDRDFPVDRVLALQVGFEDVPLLSPAPDWCVAPRPGPFGLAPGSARAVGWSEDIGLRHECVFDANGNEGADVIRVGIEHLVVGSHLTSRELEVRGHVSCP